MFVSQGFAFRHVSEVFSLSSQITGHTSVYINEPRLSDFKQVLNKAGIQAEFAGGVLICNNNVAVRRVRKYLAITRASNRVDPSLDVLHGSGECVVSFLRFVSSCWALIVVTVSWLFCLPCFTSYV